MIVKIRRAMIKLRIYWTNKLLSPLDPEMAFFDSYKNNKIKKAKTKTIHRIKYAIKVLYFLSDSENFKLTQKISVGSEASSTFK